MNQVITENKPILSKEEKINIFILGLSVAKINKCNKQNPTLCNQATFLKI